MRAPEFRPFQKEEFPEAPWIEKLLRPLNQALGQVRSGLANGLTLGENLNAEVKTLDVTTRSEWTTATLVGGATVGDSKPPAYRYEFGSVRLRGVVTGTLAAETNFATGLPGPAFTQWLTGGAYDGSTAMGIRLEISTAGAIKYRQTSSITYISLDGITYQYAGRPPSNPAFPVRFKTSIRGKAVGVVILRAVELSGRDEIAVNGIGGLGWEQDGATVKINTVTGLAAEHTYRLTFLVLGA